MLIRASGIVTDGLYLLTFGRSCHYCLTTDNGFYLFDPGLSAHVPALLKRLNDHGLLMRNCLGVILTHPHPDRISAAAHLKSLNSNFKIIASPKLKLYLKDSDKLRAIYDEDQKLSEMFDLERSLRTISFEHFKDSLIIGKTIDDSEVMEISEERTIRVISSPGHTKESLSYLIEPLNFLITDECVGYFNGRQVAPPGCDFSIESSISTLESFLKLEINGLCMPNIGVLTAAMIPKHLHAVLQSTRDMKDEVLKAISSGISENDILESLRINLFHLENEDPLVNYNLAKSLKGVWSQLKLLLPV